MKYTSRLRTLCLASLFAVSLQAVMAASGGEARSEQALSDRGPWVQIPRAAIPAAAEYPASMAVQETEGRWLVSEDALQEYGLYSADSKKGTYWLRLPPAKDGSVLWKDMQAVLHLPARQSEGKTSVNIRHIYRTLGLPLTWEGEKLELLRPVSPTRIAPTLRPLADKDKPAADIKGAEKKKKDKKSRKKQGQEQKMGLVLFWDPLMQGDETLPPLETAQPVMSPCAFRLTNTGVDLRHDDFAMLAEAYASKGYAMWPLIDNNFDPALTHAVLSDAELQDKIIKELIGYGLLYDFKGYNIDFENINYADKDKLTAFVARLSRACRAYGLKLSMDVTPISNSMNWSRVYDRAALAPHLDYLMIMAYDQFGRTSSVAGPVASYPWVEQAVQNVTAIVPAEKVVLGMPLYMRLWYETTEEKDLPLDINEWPPIAGVKGAAAQGTAAGGPPSARQNEVENKAAAGKGKPKKPVLLVRTLPMSASGLLLEKYADYITWNDELRLYYMDLPLTTGRVQVWFEDEKSLTEKAKLITKYNLGGASFWRKGFEAPHFWQSFAPQELT